MRCPGCGKELEEEAKSCPKCNRLIVVSARDRLYSQSSESYSGVLHQQGKVIVDQDFSEEVKVATESKETIKDGRVTQPTADHKPIRIIDGSTVIDSTGITFSVTSGIIPIGDFALSIDEPEELISATAIDPDSEISLGTSNYAIFLEVWEDVVLSTEDSSLIEPVLEESGPDASTQFRVGFGWLPLAEKTMTKVELVDFLESKRKDQSHRNLIPVAILEVTEDGPIEVMHNTSEDSPYADVLKPHSIISIKGIGSKMVGPYYVTPVRHKITSSDESDSSQNIRCTNCGNENEKSDKFCRNCGTRITS